MKQVTVAIAGCGSRGLDTYAFCGERFPERMKIVAAADPRSERLDLMRRRYGLTEDQCFSSAEEMLAKDRLADAMLICTPDVMHYSEAMEALKKGYHLLLEKPIAPTEEQCLAIEREAALRDRHVMICHVLRYTVFYRKLKDLITSGAVGEPIGIQAIERVCYWHQAHSFVRGNWRNEVLSSPMILQKCCHDTDILLWLAGRHCRKVSSFGSLRHFRKEFAPEGAPERCTDGCPAADTCPFNAEAYYLGRLAAGETGWPLDVVTRDATEEGVLRALREGPYGRCVYRCDNDVVDHQTVMMELEDGMTVDLTMCAFTGTGGRTIRIMGTRGELYGDMETNTIRVLLFRGEEYMIDVNTLAEDLSGHAGGDAALLKDFLTLVGEGKCDADAVTTVSASVESHRVAFAAEQSRKTGQCVIL